MTRICIYMTPEEVERAKDWCEKHQDPIFNEDESRSNLVRMALDEYIERHP